MILSNSILSLDTFFGDDIIINKNINRLELRNCKVDNVKIDENLIDFSSIKEKWGYDTILLAEFKDSLEAGNINNNGLPIKQIKIKKRKIEDLKWQDVAILEYDKNIHDYDYKDRMVEALQDYEYAIQPIAEGDILGEEKYEQIECDFDGMWLVGRDEQYQFYYNSEQGDLEIINKVNAFETLDSQYPIVIQNGKVNYRKTSIKALLVSNKTIEDENKKCGKVDRKAEKKLRNDVTNFIRDGKPKIYKNSEGIYMLVRIINNPKFIPKNDIGRQLYEVSMDIIEIGNANDNSTIKKYFNDLDTVKNVY